MLSNLKKLVRGFSRTPSSVNLTAQRFLEIFSRHGVEVTQISRLLSQIEFSDLQSEDRLLSALTPDILDQVAKLFGIRIEWLEGIDDQIYESLFCYKRPNELLEHLSGLLNGRDPELHFPLRILATTTQLDRGSAQQQLMVPVLVEKITELGERDICRYHLFNDGFDWRYSPTRIELKAIARLVFKKLHTPVPLFVVSKADMDAVMAGRVVPRRFFDCCLLSSPSLEDFALDRKESGVAKECEELSEVLRYIEDNGLAGFSFGIVADLSLEPVQPAKTKTDDWGGETPASAAEIPQEDDPSVVPTPPAIKKTGQGKRAENTRRLWEPVRTLVQSWLAEEDRKGNALSIADAIERIHKQCHLPASQLTDSAIRKRIDDLWSPEARKPGRKKKKSP